MAQHARIQAQHASVSNGAGGVLRSTLAAASQWTHQRSWPHAMAPGEPSVACWPVDDKIMPRQGKAASQPL